MLSLSQKQLMAERLFPSCVFTNSDHGILECPGQNLHSTPTQKGDTRIHLYDPRNGNSIPSIHCFHSNCREVVAQANFRLRSAIGQAEHAGKVKNSDRGNAIKLSPEQKRQQEEKHRAQVLKNRTIQSKERIFKEYEWPWTQILDESPIRLPEDPDDDWKLFLSLYDPEDVLWIGDKTDTGKPWHLKHFRPVNDWLKLDEAPAPLICPAIFKPNVYSRSNNNVLKRKFLVVESDILSADQVGAVFKWMQQFLKLCAIISTAGKSLHAWFEFPGEKIQKELEIILPILDCDPKLFSSSQPARLPSWRREYSTTVNLPEGFDPWGTQSLLWLGGRK